MSELVRLVALRVRSEANEDVTESTELLRLWLERRSQRSSGLRIRLLCQIARSASFATALTAATLRSYVPAFKQGMATSMLSGNLWIQQCLQHENDRYMREIFGMSAGVFEQLCIELRLKDGRSVSKELQLATFLLIVKGGMHLRLLGDRVQTAKDTSSKYFKLVIDRLIDMDDFYTKYVKMPAATAPTAVYISEDRRFKGYFDGCVGAVDGTHVPVFRKAVLSNEEDIPDWGSFRDRHGRLTWAALVVCNFDIQFMYVLPGFEGAAHDGKLWDFAIHRDLELHASQWLLGDNGFPLCDEVLTPYIGVRYHLQEWMTFLHRKLPNQRLVKDYAELFNLRHASARNVVERTFGVLKRRFPILQTAPEYSVKTQSMVLPALCALHNFLRCHNDPVIEKALSEESMTQTLGQVHEADDTTDSVTNTSNEKESARRRRARCARLRDELAQKMWTEYCKDIANDRRERFGQICTVHYFF